MACLRDGRPREPYRAPPGAVWSRNGSPREPSEAVRDSGALGSPQEPSSGAAPGTSGSGSRPPRTSEDPAAAGDSGQGSSLGPDTDRRDGTARVTQEIAAGYGRVRSDLTDEPCQTAPAGSGRDGTGGDGRAGTEKGRDGTGWTATDGMGRRDGTAPPPIRGWSAVGRLAGRTNGVMSWQRRLARK